LQAVKIPDTLFERLHTAYNLDALIIHFDFAEGNRKFPESARTGNPALAEPAKVKNLVIGGKESRTGGSDFIVRSAPDNPAFPPVIGGRCPPDYLLAIPYGRTNRTFFGQHWTSPRMPPALKCSLQIA